MPGGRKQILPAKATLITNAIGAVTKQTLARVDADGGSVDDVNWLLACATKSTTRITPVAVPIVWPLVCRVGSMIPMRKDDRSDGCICLPPSMSGPVRRLAVVLPQGVARDRTVRHRCADLDLGTHVAVNSGEP